jgi:dUTP pyrophosphatase
LVVGSNPSAATCLPILLPPLLSARFFSELSCRAGSVILDIVKKYLKMAAILSQQDIHRLLQQEPPLIEGYINVDEQVQPNGVDLTLREVAMLQSPGRIAVKDSQRLVSNLAPLVFDGLGFIDLMPGVYIITYNEIVHLPKNVMALATPRSSLLRCGVMVNTAVWDAGYSGRSQSLLVVYNPQGFRLQRNARIVQLVFLWLTGETEGYHGAYQQENID